MMAKRFFTAAACMLLITAVGLGQITIPPAPTNLTAAQTPDPIPAAKLSWTAPGGLYGFVVYRSITDTSHFERIAATNAPVYVDHAVKVGYAYYYYVTAIAMMSSSVKPVESAPSNIARISFTAAERAIGMITGTVTDDSTGKPIPGVRILFYRMRASVLTIDIPWAVTDSLGQYAAKLDTGTYKINAQPAPWMPPGPPAYQPEWYDNKKEMSAADPVQVMQNASVIANFGLSRPTPPVVLKGTISGKVIDDSTALPIRNILVRFYNKRTPSATNWQPSAITDSLGMYSAIVDTGTYFVRAEGSNIPSLLPIYLPEWFDNVTEVAQATPVTVTTGSTFTANFGLSRRVPPVYASIQGTVTDTLGQPLRRATVVIMRSFQEVTALTATAGLTVAADVTNLDVDGVGFCRGVVWSGPTDSLGKYQARVLSGHGYIALAAKWGYVPEYYNNKPDPLLADVINVTADVKNVNFSLAPNPLLHNSVSGVVHDSAGAGVPSIVVLIPVTMSPMALKMRFGHTDSTGAYTVGDVMSGTYVIMAVPFEGYAPAFFKAGAYGVMRWQLADKVVLNGDVSGIDIGVVAVHSNGFVRFRGHILAGGLPLAGARVMATTAGGDLVGCGFTESTGQYTLEALPQGSMTLTVDREDYASAQRPVSVTANQFEVTGLDFALTAQGTTEVSTETSVPASYQLGQNYPNPFNPSTTISFDLPVNGMASLKVFNTLGQEVRTLINGPIAAGRTTIVWNANDQSGRAVASGVYFYRLTVNGAGKELFTSVRKMLLVR
jgi:hypothetical protein